MVDCASCTSPYMSNWYELSASLKGKSHNVAAGCHSSCQKSPKFPKIPEECDEETHNEHHHKVARRVRSTARANTELRRYPMMTSFGI